MPERLYSISLVAMFVAAVCTFIVLIFIPAPYGRHARKGWGLSLKPRLAWFLMESPSALVMILMALTGSVRNLPALVFFLMWESHYLYRGFIYPFICRDAPRKVFPALILSIAVLFNATNAFVNGWCIFHSGKGAWDQAGSSWVFDARFMAGFALFVSGFFIHARSDAILRRLRPRGETGYRIPRGFLFELVSSPNYLGEILEWCGFAIATWSIPGLSFACFTFANLFPRALANHRWYRKTFQDYPVSRKAIMPFIL